METKRPLVASEDYGRDEDTAEVKHLNFYVLLINLADFIKDVG